MSSTLESACRNIRETYVALAEAIPETRIERLPGFLYAQGPLPHPVCNFAIDLRFDPWVARELAAIAKVQQGFLAYQLPTDVPEYAAELLERAGFCEAYALEVMVSMSPGEPNGISLVRLETERARQELASFMAAQFFDRQTADFRRGVQQATAGAEGLGLYRVDADGAAIGGVMICDDELVGFYNLCIEPSLRGKGLGSKAVVAIQRFAAELGKGTTLQCENRLASWYARFGFEAVGQIGVYKLMA